MSEVASKFAGRRVAVIGASGFLGAHLVASLSAAGARVVAMARGTATADVIPGGVELVLGDVRSRTDVQAAIAEAELVFLMAGRSGAGASFQEPAEDLDVNARGLLTVLDCVARAQQPPKVVFPGSRLEYGAVRALPVPEDAPLAPNSPYGLHKVLCEQYLDLYAKRFGVRYAVARLTNPYGPGVAAVQRGYNVVTHFIARALAGEEIPVFGDGLQLRDYVFVDDVSDALMRLALCEDDAYVANVGSGEGLSVADAVRRIVEIVGGGKLIHVSWPDDALRVETGDFVAETTKMRSLGWIPRTSFDEGVARTAASIRAKARL